MHAEQSYSSLDCSVEEGVRVWVIKLQQLLDDVSDQLRREFLAALREPGPNRLVLSLERVRYISSAGIGVLFTLLKRIKEEKGQLALCGLCGPVKQTLRICQLIEEEGGGSFVFLTEEDIPAAVRRLSAAS